jgi:hypothetical protein
MSKQEKIDLIKQLVAIVQTSQKQLDDIYAIFGCCEFDFAETFYKLVDLHINLISEKVGDKSEWISWFLFETNCGESTNGVEVEGKEYTIKTVEDLVEICLETP